MGKKKKKSKVWTINDVSAKLREFILDSQVQNAHELSVILGCGKISDELAEREEEESDKRVERISHLIPLLYAHAHALAEGSIEYQKSNLPPELQSLSDEMWIESRKLMEQIAISALVGSVSQLVDLGLLKLPKNRKKDE
jgi:hypothetical protein